MNAKNAGVQSRASLSQSLGESDPRARRTAQSLTDPSNFAPPLFIDDFGRLAIRLGGGLSVANGGLSIQAQSAESGGVSGIQSVSSKVPANASLNATAPVAFSECANVAELNTLVDALESRIEENAAAINQIISALKGAGVIGG